jgi:hypothetical protein
LEAFLTRNESGRVGAQWKGVWMAQMFGASV